jgi:hypothetical protein
MYRSTSAKQPGLAGKIAVRLIHSLVGGWKVVEPVEVEGPEGDILGCFEEMEIKGMSKTLICHVAKSTPLAVTGATLSESHVTNSLRYRARHFLSFRSVNHTAGPDYDPGL